VEHVPPAGLPAYDPACYLCPGNERAGGVRNPAYTGTFVFDNDFAALRPTDVAPVPAAADPLFTYEPEPGLCRVICFSPRHDLTLPELPQPAVEQVVQTWIAQSGDLAARDFINYVQVFENKGAQMGASNPHPHSQVWASGHLPNEPAKELRAQADYHATHGRCLLCDYLAAERAAGERVVLGNAHCTALVPYWAIWPFETLVVFNRHCAHLADLTPEEVAGLADVLRRLTARYDNLFHVAFPYSMGFHPAPVDGQPHSTWHLHLHFYPPLLRSATVRKFMVGYELLAMPQRDLTPEQAADRLRALSDVHYRAAEAGR
jgi:UDPglucose--hexose-1-phosphate uridylyltransferase